MHTYVISIYTTIHVKQAVSLFVIIFHACYFTRGSSFLIGHRNNNVVFITLPLFASIYVRGIAIPKNKTRQDKRKKIANVLCTQN